MSAQIRWRGWSQFAADFDRINHILIPSTKEDRDRWRASPTARVFFSVFLALSRFTDDGQLLLAFTFITGIVALDVKRTDAYLAWATLSGFLFASWACSSFVRLRGVAIDVVMPRRVTAGDETTFTLALRNTTDDDYETIVVRGPFLPWDGSWTKRGGGLARLSRNSTSRIELRARFRSRGEHHVDPFRVHALVPFGLTLGPAIVTEGVRFLAVPRIANVVSIALPQGRRHQPGGIPRASGTADSRELVGVRPYRFGDPVRDLHARTWARVGEPVVREYREEYFSRIGIVLDTDLGQDPDTQFEAAVSLVAGIIAELGRTEAIVDVVVLGRAAHPLSVGRGLGTLDRALELLACVEPEGNFDPNDLALHVLPRLTSLSCLVFVALRWDDAREAFAEEVRRSGTTCQSFVIAEGESEQGSPVRRVSAKHVHAREPVTL